MTLILIFVALWIALAIYAFCRPHNPLPEPWGGTALGFLLGFSIASILVGLFA